MTIRARLSTAGLTALCAASLMLASCSETAGDEFEDTSAQPVATVTIPTVDPIVQPTDLVAGASATTPATAVPVTIPHGPLTTVDRSGNQIPALAASTATSIHEAAYQRNYGRLRDIIGDRRFRWGFVGEKQPAEQWENDFVEGKSDEVARILLLLELPPAVDSRGNTIWPGLAIVDPAEWTADDEAALARLGFNPENITDTKIKGRYVDYRLVIDPNGTWTAFGIA